MTLGAEDAAHTHTGDPAEKGREATRTLHACFEDVTVVAIHDDVQLVGEPHRVLEALRMLVGQVDVARGLSPTGANQRDVSAQTRFDVSMAELKA